MKFLSEELQAGMVAVVLIRICDTGKEIVAQMGEFEKSQLLL